MPQGLEPFILDLWGRAGAIHAIGQYRVFCTVREAAAAFGVRGTNGAVALVQQTVGDPQGERIGVRAGGIPDGRIRLRLHPRRVIRRTRA